MLRLLIYDPAFARYEALLDRLVQTPWMVDGNWGDEGWLRQELRSADALLATRLKPEWRELAPRLRALFYPGAGVVHQDPADLPTGCVMTRVFEHGSPIAEYVMYMMLRHVGRFEEHAAAFREGYWSGSGRVAGAPHGELAGKTVSVLGFGTIGREVKRRAEAFGMTVRRKTSAVEDWGFWDQCDFLVTACPLTEATRGIVDREKLARLKDGAMLIHVSRGEVVEEEALYRELESGRLSAAMDVWYQYPEDLGESAHGSRWPFQQLPNVVATPHLSAWTHGLIERRMRKIAANMDRLAQGQKLFDVVLMGSWRM